VLEISQESLRALAARDAQLGETCFGHSCSAGSC
jgi:hypothetical protein